MKQEDFEITHWYIQGFGEGNRICINRQNSGLSASIQFVITPPHGANHQSYVEGYRDAIEMFKQ